MKKVAKLSKETVQGIGERIAAVRKELGMSQKNFAETIGTYDSYVSNVETGFSPPNLGFIHSLSTIHNVNLNFLLLGEGDMFNDKKPNSVKQNREFVPNIETIEEMVWFMEKSNIFRNAMFIQGVTYLIENQDVIKKNIQILMDQEGKEQLEGDSEEWDLSKK